MDTLKTITTVLIAFMMYIILISSRKLRWKRDKKSIIGFGFMEIVYIFSLICMWAQHYSLEHNSVEEDTSYKRVVAGSIPAAPIDSIRKAREF